jgi:hypothetical protein
MALMHTAIEHPYRDNMVNIAALVEMALDGDVFRRM